MIVRSLARKEMRILLRDRLSAGLLLGMPVLFIVVLGLLVGEGFGQKPDDRLRVSLVDLDRGLPGLDPGHGLPAQAASTFAFLGQSGPGSLLATATLHSGALEEKRFPHQPWSKVVQQDLRETADLKVELIPSLEEAQRLIRESRRAAIVVLTPDFSARIAKCSFLADGVNPFFRDGVRLDQIGIKILKDETQVTASSIISQVIQVTLLRVILPYMIGDAFEKLSDPSFIDRLGKEVILPIPILGRRPLNSLLRTKKMKLAVGRGVQNSIATQFPKYNLTGKTWAALTKSKSRPDFGLATVVGLGFSPQAPLMMSPMIRKLEEVFERDAGVKETPYRDEGGSGFLNRGAARYQILVPSYTVMFAFSLVLTVGWLFVLERRQGTLKRLRAAPITRGQILLGKFLPCFAIAIFQGIFLLIIGKVIFGMTWGPASWPLVVRFLVLLCIVIPTALTATSMALFIAAFTRSEIQVGIIGSLLVLLMGLLSGCLIPRELMPETMTSISRVTPHAWALDAYRQLLVRSPSATEITPNLQIVARSALVLLGFGLGFLGLAWKSIRLD